MKARRSAIARPVIFVGLAGLLLLPVGGMVWLNRSRRAAEMAVREKQRQEKERMNQLILHPELGIGPLYNSKGEVITPKPVKYIKIETPNAVQSAAFSPDGQFLAAGTEKNFLIWTAGGKPAAKPVFRTGAAGTLVRWNSPRSGILKPELGFQFYAKQRKWGAVKDPRPTIPLVRGELRVEDGEQVSNSSGTVVPASHAVVWGLFNSSPNGTDNDLGDNNRVAISSLPDGQVFTLPESMRLTGGPQSVTLAPRKPGAKLLAATTNTLTGHGGSRLRVFNVSAGEMLWEKKFTSFGGKVVFSADGRYLIGVGMPRLQGSDASETDRSDGVYIWESATGRLVKSWSETDIDSSTLQFNAPRNTFLYFKRTDSVKPNYRMVGRSIPDAKVVLRYDQQPRPKFFLGAPQIRISPDGKMVALASREGLRLVPWSALLAGQGDKKGLAMQFS